MSEIRLEDSKINHEGEWLSAEDLTGKIQEKMQAGDMNIAQLAAALEELSNALENACVIEVSMLLSKEEYEKLKSLGGGDDSQCVRQAISAFVGGEISESGTGDSGAADENKTRVKDHFLG